MAVFTVRDRAHTIFAPQPGGFMLCLNRDEDIPINNRVIEIALFMFVCLHGHFRYDPRITPLVVEHALIGFAVNAAEPNLRIDDKPAPILTGPQAKAYEEYLQGHARAAGKPDHLFLMILQLTSATTPETVREAYAMGYRIFKYYPHGVTTNSDTGVKGWWGLVLPAIQEMARINAEYPDAPIVLQVHAEESEEQDPWKREEAAIPQVEWLATMFPGLVISFEHVSTSAAVELARRCKNVYLSISIVHMTLTKDDVVGHDHRLHPHCWCAPVAKSELDRQRLVQAATGQIPELVHKVYLGLDFAPHAVDLKEATEWTYPPEDGKSLPPMGAYSLDVAVGLLIALFQRVAGLDWIQALQRFTHDNGPDVYKFERPTSRMLVRLEPWEVPQVYHDHLGRPTLRSFMAGQTVSWRIVHRLPDQQAA